MRLHDVNKPVRFFKRMYNPAVDRKKRLEVGEVLPLDVWTAHFWQLLLAAS